MKKNFSKTMVLCTALLAAAFVGCKENNTPTDPTHNPHEDGGLVADDNLLYDNNVIGNGDDEFVFTGKQTLRRGTYLLKGWVYVADGAELTIEPGTVGYVSVMYRLCIGYVSVILYAGPDVVGSHFRISLL